MKFGRRERKKDAGRKGGRKRERERDGASSRKGVLEMVREGNYAVEAIDLGREENETPERGRQTKSFLCCTPLSLSLSPFFFLSLSLSIESPREGENFESSGVFALLSDPSYSRSRVAHASRDLRAAEDFADNAEEPFFLRLSALRRSRRAPDDRAHAAPFSSLARPFPRPRLSLLSLSR